MDDHLVNYRDIGSRVKECRKMRGYTQEKLAEMANISIQHMSNIENAATKLSLPTIIALADALSISVDRILIGSSEAGKAVLNDDFSRLLEDCSIRETQFLYELAKSAKNTLRNHKNILE